MKVLKKNPNIPDSMMMVIAWIMGEYVSDLPKTEKKMQILEKLCEASYRTFEDESTRAWVLSAITKIHAGLGFMDNTKVDETLTNYSQSKNVEVQQRCHEYK